MDELRKNYVILLSGGIGSRMQGSSECPKQYRKVNGKPVFLYSLLTFEKCQQVDGIIIVADAKWSDYISEYIDKYEIHKVIGFANPGNTRQQSIFSALKKLNNVIFRQDIIMIHDAVRPNVKESLISACIEKNQECDGVLPCVPVKDTIYESINGSTVSGLLKRDILYAGQAPESFVYGKYYDAHLAYSESEIASFSGSTELAIKNNMNIQIIKGDELNYKITTIEDFHKFKHEQGGNYCNESVCT